MRCGCIAIAKVQCNGCHRPIEYGERYLLIDSKEGESQRYCVDCCLTRGYASYRTEGGEKILTFLSEK